MLNIQRGSAAPNPPVTGTIVLRDEGAILGSVATLDFTGAGVNVSISGTYGAVSVPGGGGTPSGTIYMLAGMAQPLEPSDQFWRVPIYPYATGSLSIMLNGVWQKPGLDFTEQWPVSGTFALAAPPPTGSVSAATWGVRPP